MQVPAAVADRDRRAVLNAIRHIVRALRESAHAAQGRTGLSGAQLFVLRALAREPGLSINDLAARTMTHQSSVSVVVSRLVALGLAARAVAPDDRRRVVLTLTAKGREAHRRAPVMAQELLVQAARELPPRQLRPLAAGLEALAGALGATGAAPEMFFEESPDEDQDEDHERKNAQRGRA
jgi:DNA-binding MarR family transcriptional regulator